MSLRLLFCEKCTVHGEHLGKVVFPSVDIPLRSDADFDAMTDDDHHLIPCPLSSLGIRVVSQFALDCMHLACLGFMRRFMLYWKGPVGSLAIRMRRSSVIELSERIVVFAAHSPLEFA